MDRPSTDIVMLSVAEVLATRATCPRLHAGAVICNYNNRIVGTGYNGAPHGHDHCEDAGCVLEGGHCVRSVHAEANALLQAGPEAENATLYVTTRPCIRCLLIIVQSNIHRIVVPNKPGYDTDGQGELFNALCQKSGILVNVADVTDPIAVVYRSTLGRSWFFPPSTTHFDRAEDRIIE